MEVRGIPHVRSAAERACPGSARAHREALYASALVASPKNGDRTALLSSRQGLAQTQYGSPPASSTDVGVDARPNRNLPQWRTADTLQRHVQDRFEILRMPPKQS